MYTTMLPSGPYNPAETEARILKYWLENQFYKPEYDPVAGRVQSLEEMKANPREPWALICPPPNAYARPHIGNISGYAYQDAMARYQRMRGKKVLVMPGKDHAGLEGEGVFVREVLEKQGRKKFEMNREDFYAEMMDFFKKNMDIARNDEKNIGLSADYDRDIFTLDPRIVDTVLDTFVEMHQQGMIYKGVRIVNWDPKARTAVADNQIEYEDAITPFVYFKYAFTTPEVKALELKREFEGKTIDWQFERFMTKDGKSELTFHYGHINHNGEDVEIMAYGFGADVTKDQMLNGKVIGIQMRLDNKFRLVVLQDGADIDLQEAIAKSFLFEAKYYAGAHIILFAEYPEDKFYTNGFVLGTVRPETKFGDTALAVDPKDERYQDFVGKQITVQTLNGEAKLNIIADYAVDKDFGTGMVKVTPAHSPTDWEIAQRHPAECLPAKQVIGYDLKLNHLTGKYAGMSIKEARPVIMQDMQTAGMLIYVDENYTNRIQIAERTKAPIEPLLSSQWYLKYDGIKEAAMEMVKTKQVTIHPQSMEAKFNHWMENLRDWAISRSLWWGYRLPVWYAGQIKEEIGQDGQVQELIQLSGASESIPLEYDNPQHVQVQKESPGANWVQDDSVLDTWFSSGQWVYATLGAYDLMDTFFPTDVLVSAHDILENWDSRMMMFTYFKLKNIPFKDLYLTGLVTAADGQKMSKSKGNVVDVDKVIADFGTDSLRMTYFYQNSAGGNYAITPDKLKNFKQFHNKLWNAAKFVEMNMMSGSQVKLDDLKLDFARDLATHTQTVIKKVTQNIESFEFGHATETLYQEFWHTFCDDYIERSKEYLLIKTNKETGEIISEPKLEDKAETQQVLYYALRTYLQLLHPFIPFITEQIWQHLPKLEGDSETIMYSRWPNQSSFRS